MAKFNPERPYETATGLVGDDEAFFYQDGLMFTRHHDLVFSSDGSDEESLVDGKVDMEAIRSFAKKKAAGQKKTDLKEEEPPFEDEEFFDGDTPATEDHLDLI